MEQGAGGQQVTLVQHALGQHVGVHTGFHPAKQTRRFGRKGAACGQCQLDAAPARGLQPGADTFGVAAQLALLDTQGECALQQRRGGQGGQQLGIEQALNQRRGCGHKPHTPVGGQDLGKTADVDGALQAVECAQAGGVFGGDVAVGVVFNDVEVVLLGQLQHAVRVAGGEAVARGVVEHTHTHKQLGRVGFAVPRHHLQVGPVGAARHRQDTHAQSSQPGKFDRPAGLFHHHRVTRLQQCAAHDVECVGGPDGGDDLARGDRNVDGGQSVRQHLAQGRVTHGVAVFERMVVQQHAAGGPAHGGGHEASFQPIGREHPRAGLRFAGRLVEHAPDQGRGVDL